MSRNRLTADAVMREVPFAERPLIVRKRTSLTALVAAGALAASTAVALATSAPSFAAGDVYSVAPYTDMSNSQHGMLDTAITQHGLKAYTAAFVIGAGCNQEWGDTLPVGNDSFTDPEIAQAKSEGASVIISSGGAAGEPLAWTCSTQSSIEAGYQNIISSYGVSWLDFDVEGAAVADTAAAARHMQAMKDLKASNSGLKFSMTLPVLPSGLTNDGVNILKAAKNAGIKIDVVNIMTMDYYQGQQDMGQAAITAAQNTLAQMKSVDSSYTYANLGITPMIGTNDDGSVFTLANASTVRSWANSNGVGRLAFWSVNRDQSCGGGSGGSASSTCSSVSQSPLAFTDAFLGGGGGGGSGTPTPTPTPTPTGSCTAPAYSNSQVYTGGQQVSYNGHTWTAKWWTQGDAPSTGGSGVWTDDGPCSGSGGGTPTPTPTPTPTATPTPTPTPTSTPPSGVQPWAPNVAYTVGDEVTYNGVTYKCLQSHTSQVGWEPPNVPALWQPV